MGDSDDTSRREPRRMPVVGIGASAGGIDALQRLLPHIPPDCDIAFVIVQHLDPEHKSILAEVLTRASRLPVQAISDDMMVAANTVYVIPPNATLTIEDGRLRLEKPSTPRGFRTPVDHFLCSLAEERRADAACVILSGTGSDGTIGLRAIKEQGGLTLAQAGAEYDGMMRSAVTTGLVDEVLPAEQIAGKLIDYFRHPARIAAAAGAAAEEMPGQEELTQIFTLLRTRTGHDFRDYKDRTVRRRVQRRMQVLQIRDVQQLVDRLRRDPHQLDLLFQDLLIGVTNFFRDAPAFAALEREAIPQLFEGKTPSDTVRVWVAGCSTGEEAYSIAALLREYAPKSHEQPKLQVFASDIDEQALEVARTGRYPAAIGADVPKRLLDRYFVREDGTYRVVSELREICLFSAHNLLRDAPFSRLDLVSCRNLLIYLNPGLQTRVIPLLHYALRDGGFLFLGPSENVTRHPSLFSVVDKSHRIFRRRALPERQLPEFPLTAPDAALQRSLKPSRSTAAEGNVQVLAERRLLENYAPPYVVVNNEGEVLQASSRTGQFLELPAGTPDTSIFNLARPGLRFDLREVMQRAQSTGQPAVRTNVKVGDEGNQQAIELWAHPLRHETAQDRMFMVVFRATGSVAPAEPAVPEGEAGESQTLRQMEQEIGQLRERLQTTTEELESSNEELKSSNEELSSMNEELQSANEELETSREELQSINEELQTVNAELSTRVEELSRANNDVVNLLESTQIATVFLDRDLRVKSFTPAARDVLRLVESDAGRPISHVRPRFEPDNIQDAAERVLRTLATIEREVISTDSDARFIMRILPYRTVDNVISGVVITFTDIARISAAEARISELAHDLRNRIESLETLLDLVPVGIFILEERDRDTVRVNRRGAQMLGAAEDQKGMGPAAAALRLRVKGRELPPGEHPLQRAADTGQPSAGFEAELLRDDGSALDVLFSATPLFNEGGKARGAIAAVVDITARKLAEQHQQVLLHELQHRVKNILATIAALAQRMLRSGVTVVEFAPAFLDRLHAMGRMHDLLSRRNWVDAELRELIATALTPYGGDERQSLALDGPSVRLPPETAATLGMMLNELATNAAKYGALSAGGGHVSLSWSLAGAALHLVWREIDGPQVPPPDHEGFGIGFVRRSVEYELAGSFDIAFRQSGIECLITFPLRSGADVLA